ncbi:protein NPAT-like [Argiope bruennichi]|uniref:protein NPAT-like n=1 Tax=Argiope bruennichi TaxID=94029 RepID=UPI0024945DB9|nr:protein NPAT-like [Argiope bruennichi]
MADYYPSEVARLVLGYLKEANCLKTWESFLGESIDLQEHCRLLQSGRSCTTNIEGKSLLDILHEYRFLKDTAGRNTRNETNSSSANLNTSHLYSSSNNINTSSSNINLNSSNINPSSSNINPSASCTENFKTPKKNNAEAFNRFKVHQATQSQATIRFAQVGNRTPRSMQAYLSTPTRQHSSRTPSRLQGVCVTTLNFGTGAERNEEPISVHRGGIFDTPKSRPSASVSSQRLCYSDTIKRRPVMISKLVQTETVNTSQVVIDNTNCQTSSNSPSHQILSERASTESSHQLTNSVNSANYCGENQIQSNPESRNSLTNSEENLNDSRLMLLENKTTANTAVVNQTIVFTSTEIRTSGDNESSVTPQYDIEPPPYARAPNTNSPRLILSFDRSQVSSLTTPMKDRRHWTEEFASPKRKGTIPRRRLLSESPHSKQIASNDNSFVSIHENVESIIEELMANQPFTQRLADNINKVICEEPEASNSNFPTLQDIQNSDIVIQNILARAESDSLFNDIISLFGNSRDCDDLNIQESAAETSEINFLTEGTQTNKDECEQATVTETSTSKDETDNSKNHDNMQEKNNDQNSENETSSQLPSSSEVTPLSSESAANQNTPTVANVEDPEPMQVDHDKTNLTQESGPKDLLGSCMSIIQPDTETHLQDCNFEQNNDVPDDTNEVQSSPSDVNESSTPVPVSVTENITGLDDTSTLKPVSIGTPFQVGSQIAVSQATSNINQSIPTSQTIVCYPPSSLTNSTMSFIPSNRNIPILPAVQNQGFILNSNFQPSPLLQFSYSPAPSFPVQSLDNFQSKIIVVQQPCPTHSLNATNWTNNNLTNDVIIPVQTVSAENVAQPSVINQSPIKIPHDYSPSKSFLASNVGNFVTVTSETAQSKKNADKKQSSKFNIPASPAKNSLGKKKSKRPPKKKRRPLFPSPKDPDNPPESEISDYVPVLSIPDPSPNKDESMSAMEILTSITEGANTQSPLLKAMISSAKILAEKGGRLNSTHVRTLEFSAPETVQEEGNKSKQSRTSTEIDGRRSSPRLKQKTSCKSPCCSPLKPVENANAKKNGSKLCTKEKVDMTADLVSNAIEKLTAHKAVSSSMSSVVLSAMQDALQAKPVKSKKQDSSSVCDVFQRAEISLSPIKKTPLKVSSIGKKAISRDQYFPDSSSASDSESDNIPLSLIIASKSKDTNIKETETSTLKQNNTQKSNVEKETNKSVVEEILPCADKECINKLALHKASELSESSAVPLNTKSTELSKAAVGKSSFKEDSNSHVNISKTVCPNKENKSSKKANGSKKIKSNKLDHHIQQESSKVSEEIKKVPDNSPCDLIVLDSDEDMEVPEIENENIASPVICSSESKSSKKEQKRKRKKKKLRTKLISPSKEKALGHKKSERRNSSVSRKSNSPRISETSDNLLKSDKSSPRSEKNSCKVSQENFTEEKQNNKKSKSEDSNMSKKLSEKININETNNHPLSNEETDAPSQKNNSRISQKFPIEKQISSEKDKWYISSPQKEKEVCHSDSLEKSQYSSGTIKKSKKIDELCDKLRLNVVQNSPKKEGTINSLTKALHKLPPVVTNITAKNSTHIPVNETSFEQGLLPSETTAPLNPAEKETLKPTSIEILGTEKSVIYADIRNTVTLDPEITINSKQSSISDEPIKPNVKKRVLPPPKKRIRPVPVASPRDGRFSPFSPFSSPAHSVCFDSTLKPKEIPSISRNPSDSPINKIISCLSDLPSPAQLPFIDPPSRPVEMHSIARNISNAEEINETVSSAPELSSPINTICSETTVKTKEMSSVTPINVGPVRKCSAGKPKAMAEFYKSALPDRESDLPISPDPMSSSSCTLDTLLARRNIPSADICETASNKENSLINKISPKKKEAEKVSQKRKLSSTSIKDSSDEEGLIKSPSRAETIVRNTSDTETASEYVALLSPQVHLKDVHLSSSDEEGLIKSPVKNLSHGQKSDQISVQPEKKQKLSTGFSPHLENLNSSVSDQLKSVKTDSFLLHDKTAEKHLQEEKSPVHHSILLNKAKSKSNLKKNVVSPVIPAGVKIPDKWNNSKINNYSSIITRPEDETRFKGPRRSRPNIKVVGFKSPSKPSSSFKRKNEHPSSHLNRPNPYRTLYSERQARRLQLENRRSSFRQSPNLNNNRSSTHPHRHENKHITSPNFNYSESNLSFSKESTTRNYSRKKHEHRDISNKSSEIGCRNNDSQKHLFPYESSSNRNTSKHESSNSNFKVSEKDLDHQDSSNKHKQKERTILLEKSNPVKETRDKLSTKNIANVEVPEKPNKNITSVKKSNESFHKQASSSNFPDDEEKGYNKGILAKEKLISTNNKHKSANNLSDENKASLVSEKCDAVFEKSRIRLEVDQIQQNKLSYNEDTELSHSESGTLLKESHTELRQESQLENSSQILNTEQNKEGGDEHSDLNDCKIFDEAVGSLSRTSTDQKELDQAVAFLTNDEVPKSQEPVKSSQNIADGDKVTDDAPDKDSDDFGALVIKQLSKAAGLSVPMQVQDISHLLEKIKELGLENIADIFGQKK